MNPTENVVLAVAELSEAAQRGQQILNEDITGNAALLLDEAKKVLAPEQFQLALLATLKSYQEYVDGLEKMVAEAYAAGILAGVQHSADEVRSAFEAKGLKVEDVFDPCGDPNCECASA